MLTNQNFTMIAGDSKNINVSMLDGVSLDGATVRWALKQGSTVASKTTSSGITIAGSTFTIRLNSADTASLMGKYYHEAEMTDMFGNVSTVMSGNITIERSNV